MSTFQKKCVSLLPFIAPLLLLFIAFFQFLNVSRANLSPWKGGGFGMFSTVDRPNTRIFHSFFIAENDTIFFDTPNTEMHNRLKLISYTMPSNQHLDQFSDQILALDWYCIDKEALEKGEWQYCFYDTEMEQLTQEFGIDSYQVRLLQKIEPDQLQIEVWKKGYNSKANQIHKTLLNKRVYTPMP